MYRLLICLLVLLFGCTSKIDHSLLNGKWKAARIIENNTPKDLDLSLVSFEFFNDGRYKYHDNLKTEEAGRFYVVGEVLYTTDTTTTHPLEKSVRIALLSPDSLHFQMNAGGVPQVFELYKSNN